MAQRRMIIEHQNNNEKNDIQQSAVT